MFVASVFVLVLKLMSPTPLLISVGGETIPVKTVSFTFIDAAILIASSLVLGISGMYLLFFDSVEKSAISKKPAGEAVLEERRRKWEETAKTLKNDEQTIYNVISSSDGIINQSELIEATGFSKSNVSRILDLLESRELVEKRRRGMGNVIMLR